MKELQKEFIGIGAVSGFKFTQLKSGNAYIYKVEIPTGQIHYEVFKRVENARFNCISYPGENSFGLWAFTKKTIEEAELKFNELNG